MSTLSYPGSELDAFAQARNWKTYVRRHLREYLHGDVLEVGAGIGAGTRALYDGTQHRWVCLEPDPQLGRRIPREGLLSACEVRIGTLADVPAGESFDFILYFDTLEHIPDDRGELERAAAHLKIGGALAVLAPAHPWLFSPFDHAIGHLRRYTRSSLRELTPPGVRLEKLLYLDAAGVLASGANRLLLRSAHPTLGQVQFWDRVLVRISRVLDPLCAHALGKSVLAVWRAQE